MGLDISSCHCWVCHYHMLKTKAVFQAIMRSLPMLYRRWTKYPWSELYLYGFDRFLPLYNDIRKEKNAGITWTMNDSYRASLYRHYVNESKFHQFFYPSKLKKTTAKPGLIERIFFSSSFVSMTYSSTSQVPMVIQTTIKGMPWMTYFIWKLWNSVQSSMERLNLLLHKNYN